MKKALWIGTILAAFAGLVFGGYLLWDQLTRVSAAELEQIVRRDGVPFEAAAIPDQVIDEIASNRVVVVGEFHFLKEHREFVAELMRELHARGFRQYLFEWTQAADWLLDDYVNDGGLMPDWKPPHDIGGATITVIRDLNRTLPEDERIHVHGIDVTLQDYGGIEAFLASTRLLAQHFSDPGPISLFLESDHDTEEKHRALLEMLSAELSARRQELTSSWGESFYGTVQEMVEVELRAVAVRDIRDSDYDESVRLREETIKWLADRRIGSTPDGTLINIGATHSQKEGLWGTEGIEWLADYLVHQSSVTHGSVVAIWVAAQQIVPIPGSGDLARDLTDSPGNELLLVTSRIWPDRAVYLELNDPLFSDARVPVNVSGDVYIAAPKWQHDALILLPIAHRDFVGD